MLLSRDYSSEVEELRRFEWYERPLMKTRFRTDDGLIHNSCDCRVLSFEAATDSDFTGMVFEYFCYPQVFDDDIKRKSCGKTLAIHLCDVRRSRRTLVMAQQAAKDLNSWAQVFPQTGLPAEIGVMVAQRIPNTCIISGFLRGPRVLHDKTSVVFEALLSRVMRIALKERQTSRELIVYNEKLARTSGGETIIEILNSWKVFESQHTPFPGSATFAKTQAPTSLITFSHDPKFSYIYVEE